MGLFDDFTDDRSDPDAVHFRRSRGELVRRPEASHFGPLDRLKSFLLTLWYLITGKYNL